MLTSMRVIVGVAATCAIVGIGSARAQTPDSGTTTGSGSDAAGGSAMASPMPSTSMDLSSGTPPPPEDDPNAAGKFNAGGGLRFPGGPDEMGQYASFNWVALDLKGRYNPTSFSAVYVNVPLAVKHPDAPMGTPDNLSPSMFGGMTLRGEIGKPFLGLQVTLGYMKEQSFFYSDKMFPYYFGDYEPCVSVGPYINIKRWGVYFATAPTLVWQKAGDLKAPNGMDSDGGGAVQVPVSAAVHLGSMLEVAADLGLATGYGFAFDASEMGNIYAGGSLTVKVKPVKVHLGTGVAALFTDPTAPYHSIGDSVYFDLNVAYVK